MVALERAAVHLEELADMCIAGNQQMKVWGRLLKKAESGDNIVKTTDAETSNAGAETETRPGINGQVRGICPRDDDTTG